MWQHWFLCLSFVYASQITFTPEISFDFLVEGELMEYATKMTDRRFNCLIPIAFDSTTTSAKLKEVENLIVKWKTHPAFATTPESPITAEYLPLIDASSKRIVKILTLLISLVRYKTEAEPPLVSSCNVEVKLISEESILTDIKELKSDHAKISNAWTAEHITDNLDASNTLRHFALHLADITERWLQDIEKTLIIMDGLFSNTVTQELQVIFQMASCVGLKTDDKITVQECYKTKMGVSCDLNHLFPTDIKSMIPLLPVHYEKGIRLRGQTANQMFVKTLDVTKIHYLNCEHYDFHGNTPPVCELESIKENCLRPLLEKKYSDVIKNCNFTENEPPLVSRTLNKGIFIQGRDSEIQEKIRDSWSSIKTKAPVLIYTSNDLQVRNSKLETVITAALQGFNTTLIHSALSQDNIDEMIRKFYWQTVYENIIIDDVLRILILFCQVILLPITVLGLLYTAHVKRREILKMLSSKKNLRKIFRENRDELQMMRK